MTYEASIGYEIDENIDLAGETADETTYGFKSKNPAKTRFLADIKCEAYLGSGAPLAIVAEVKSMTVTLTNGSQTTYLPDGTEDTWYNVLASNPSYTHSPTGFPTINLRWVTSRTARHTVKKPGQTAVSTLRTTPYDVNRTHSAYYSGYIN